MPTVGWKIEIMSMEKRLTNLPFRFASAHSVDKSNKTGDAAGIASGNGGSFTLEESLFNGH
ncbi:MAG: hypothetical protein LBG04_02385 [Holosporaceae bacterium]|nr:hypothetical protein [Holosporaceae bacterium]